MRPQSLGKVEIKCNWPRMSVALGFDPWRGETCLNSPTFLLVNQYYPRFMCSERINSQLNIMAANRGKNGQLLNVPTNVHVTDRATYWYQRGYEGHTDIDITSVQNLPQLQGSYICLNIFILVCVLKYAQCKSRFSMHVSGISFQLFLPAPLQRLYLQVYIFRT